MLTQQKPSQNNKKCQKCKQTPVELLMLSCDHPICLTCAYEQLSRNQQNSDSTKQRQIECFVCHEATQIHQTLLKQIQSNISPLELTEGLTNYHQSDNVRRHTSSLEVQQQQAVNNSQQQQGFDQRDIENEVVDQANVSENANANANTNKANKVLLKYKLKKCEKQLLKSRNKQQSYKGHHNNHQQVYSNNCVLHEGYELLYFCKKCQKSVCPECLLHGTHKGHQNKSFKQLLRTQLPLILNNRTQNLFKRIQQLEIYQKKQKRQAHSRLKEITLIREQAIQYYINLKENILAQQADVIGKCDQLLQQYNREQGKIKVQLQIQSQIIMNEIQEVRKIKQKYQDYLNFHQQLSAISKSAKSDVEGFLLNNFQILIDKIQEQAKNEKSYAEKKIVKRDKSTQELSYRLAESVNHLRKNLAQVGLAFQNIHKPISIKKVSQHQTPTPKRKSKAQRVSLNSKCPNPASKISYETQLIKRSPPVRNNNVSPYKNNQKSNKNQKYFKPQNILKKHKNKQNSRYCCNKVVLNEKRHSITQFSSSNPIPPKKAP